MVTACSPGLAPSPIPLYSRVVENLQLTFDQAPPPGYGLSIKAPPSSPSKRYGHNTYSHQFCNNAKRSDFNFSAAAVFLNLSCQSKAWRSGICQLILRCKLNYSSISFFLHKNPLLSIRLLKRGTLKLTDTDTGSVSVNILFSTTSYDFVSIYASLTVSKALTSLLFSACSGISVI